MRALVKWYGWRVTEPGHLVRCRNVTALPVPPRLEHVASEEEVELMESDLTIKQLGAMAAAAAV